MKPLSDFYKAAHGRFGVRGSCKQCCAVTAGKWRSKNVEHTRETNRKSYLQYKAKHPGRLKAYKRKQYLANREVMIQRAAEYSKKHPDKTLAAKRRWRERHPEQSAECTRTWQKNNPEKSRLRTNRYRPKKKDLPATLTKWEWHMTLEAFDHRCAYCGKKGHPLHQDHVVPGVRGGGYEFGNIVPCCKSCNSSKNDRVCDEWMDSKRYDSLEFASYLDHLKVA